MRFSEIVGTRDGDRSGCGRSRNIDMTGKVGTVRWMAPEMIREERIYDDKVDIYSFGLILWELIRGDLPYDDIGWNYCIEEAILNGERPRIVPGSCPRAWQYLIKACWHAEPTERPDIQDVVASLDRIRVAIIHQAKACGSNDKLWNMMPSSPGTTSYFLSMDDTP